MSSYRRSTASDPIVLTPAEAGYIAGFIDGEGSLMLMKKARNPLRDKFVRAKYFCPYYFRPNLGMNQRDIDPLLFILKAVGTGWLGKLKVKSRGKTYLQWALRYDTSVLRWLLPQLVPFLILKKEQAKILIRYIEHTDSYRHGTLINESEYAWRAGIHNEIRELNLKPKQRAEGVLAVKAPLEFPKLQETA